ncbi:AhpC/TSA family protein [Polaribacter sp. BAL334]|uniref:TlpA disulfide reductase family protein n=1 Tax=Polaribacter sp. BAL334 TaxID=1708178 RepID=UPI0018D205EC|nr:TlpA disulfide reductase family protein [Polaribacter sp. BAL334]MBG7612982.1 AhpC/TSA family protein [Polaribacter sp. BAL334]
MKKIILGLIIVLIVSCKEKQKIGFSIKGKTNGFENGTLIYLKIDNKTLDSTKVENNTFKFNTKLPLSPIKLLLHNKDFSNYRIFWAENNAMIFDASKTDFRNAKITGSEAENLSFSLNKKIETLSINERQKMEIEFVRSNPNSIVSADILSIYSTTWGKEKSKELFLQFSKNIKNSKYGKEIEEYLEFNKEPKIGEQFIDFESENQNGEFKKLSELKGKTVLLEFWASWCAPCRKENPKLLDIYKKYNSKGFEIFSVSLDEDKSSWIRAINEDNLIWEQVSDLKGNRNKASLIYGVSGIPDNFLISENGKIIARNLRVDKLNKKLEEILKQ